MRVVIASSERSISNGDDTDSSIVLDKDWQLLLDLTNRLQDDLRKRRQDLTPQHTKQLLMTYNFKIRQDIVTSDPSMSNVLPYLHNFEVEYVYKEYGNRISTLADRLDTSLELAIAWLLNKTKPYRTIESLSKLFPKTAYDKFPSDVKIIIDEAVGCYDGGFYNASSVMQRKALECAIHVRFRQDNSLHELFDKDGNPYELRKRIEIAKQRRFITPGHASELIKIKWFGDVAAHSFNIHVDPEDILKNMTLLRLVLDGLFS